MRDRLIAAFVGLAIAVVSLYGVPRAFVLADQVQASEQRKIERSIELLAVIIAERAPERPVTGEFLDGLLHEAERIEYTDSSGNLVAAAGTQLSGHPDDIVITRQVPGAGTVLMSRSGSEVADRVADALAPVVLIGFVLVAVFAAVGFFLAVRLSRPFRALAGTAAQLGEGNFDVPPPAYAIPEAQAIGAALHSSSNALQELLRREREFTVNASHQLRTPVTALRLELEDLSMWPETPPAVARQLNHSLGELDRLATAVTDLLDLARGRGPSATREVDFSRILAEASQRWEREAETVGRTLTIDSPPVLPGNIAPGPVHQILDILIDNALKHGRGRIILSAREEATHHSLSVTDQGERPAGLSIFQRRRASAAAGERIGLSVAKKLAEAINGRLVLDSAPPTTFTLVVPSKTDLGAAPGTVTALT